MTAARERRRLDAIADAIGGACPYCGKEMTEDQDLGLIRVDRRAPVAGEVMRVSHRACRQRQAGRLGAPQGMAKSRDW